VEWLSHIYENGEPLSLLYEEIFISQDFDGKQLSCLSEKDFLNMGIPENHAKLLNHEKKKLLEFSRFSTNQTRFRMKLDSLSKQFEEKDFSQFVSTYEDLVYSLCDQQNILETYLSFEKHETLHKKAETIDLKDVKFEIRVILTEFTHNSKSYDLETCFHGTIDKIPPFDWDSKFDKLKCGVIVGPWYLEFGNNSLCIPKRMHPLIHQMYREIEPICVVEDDTKEIRKTIASIVADWNAKSFYRSIEPDTKKNQGNCQTFVDELLKKFDCNKFKGSLNSIMNEIKDFGDAGCSIYPAENAMEFSNAYGFSDIPDITLESHSLLDDDILNILEQDKYFRKHYPHDFIAFQSIDMAFWFRYMVNGKDIHEELLSQKNTPLCPCFQKKMFLEVFKLDPNFVAIEVEEKPKGKSFMKQVSRVRSVEQRNSSKKNLMVDLDPLRKSSNYEIPVKKRVGEKKTGISELGRKLTIFVKNPK
jgi:hypothetical protein